MSAIVMLGVGMSVSQHPYYEQKEVLLAARNLSVCYGEKVVLRGVNFDIRDISRPNTGIKQGQVVALLAPSGMGKTQLFRCLAGLQKPTEGEVLLTANNIPVKRGMVGVVPQDYPLFLHSTVLRNLTAAAGAKKFWFFRDKESSEKAMNMLKYFGLEHIAHSYPEEISGGQRQRIAVARQILSSEHVLLFDEPFSGLDVLAKALLIKLILELSVQHEQETLVVTTHDISSALAIADRVLILGRERLPDGSIVPGAFVKHDINLIDEGLAWQPNVMQLPRFGEIARSIEYDIFPTL